MILVDLDMPEWSRSSDAKDAIELVAQRIRFAAAQCAPDTFCHAVQSVIIDASSDDVCAVLSALAASEKIAAGDP